MDSSGPHLQAALICERVLQEEDGIVSAIRIVDRVYFILGPTGELLQAQHPITFLVTFKSGAARGSYSLEIRRERPSGEQDTVLSAPVFFEGEERGVNLVVQAVFAPDQAGLYWYDVYFEGSRVTRMPLRAIYQQPPTAGPQG